MCPVGNNAPLCFGGSAGPEHQVQVAAGIHKGLGQVGGASGFVFDNDALAGFTLHDGRAEVGIKNDLNTFLFHQLIQCAHGSRDIKIGAVAAGGGVHGIGPVPPAIWQVIVAVADADMQQLLRQAAIYLVPQTVIQRQIDADMAQGSQTAQDDAFLQQNDPGAIACGRNCGGYTGYAAAYYDYIRFPRNGDGMGLLSDLLWFFH